MQSHIVTLFRLFICAHCNVVRWLRSAIFIPVFFVEYVNNYSTHVNTYSFHDFSYGDHAPKSAVE